MAGVSGHSLTTTSRAPVQAIVEESLQSNDEDAIRASFVFIKENLIFESIQKELMENGLLSNREEKDYVFKIQSKHFKVERLIKLLISKKRCYDFVEILRKMPCHKHVFKKIEENRRRVEESVQQNNKKEIVHTGPIATEELLQKHFTFLYKELEPRAIADEMFQEDYISVYDHDTVTEFSTKYKRIKELFNILRRKPELYRPFSKYIRVLQTLKKKGNLTNNESECGLCVQQNFTVLQEGLSDNEDGIPMREHLYGFLDQVNLFDIETQNSEWRKTGKLLKILIMKGEQPCRELFRVLEEDLGRKDLILEMRNKTEYLKRRGKPTLDNGMRHLPISCLHEHDRILRDELDPLHVCDLLFEERALEVLDHDRISEESQRQKQMDCLLNIVKENKNDCFYFFLFILQREEYSVVSRAIKCSAQESVQGESNDNFSCRLSHKIIKEPDSCEVANAPILVRLSTPDSPRVERVIKHKFHSNKTRISEEAVTHGQTNIDNITSGSVVLQLRPLTDQAVQSLLHAKENNKLLEMVFEMLRQVYVFELMDSAESLEIKVQVFYASLKTPKANSNPTKTELIKKHIRAYRNKLLSELEPEALLSSLSNCRVFPQEVIKEMKTATRCSHKIEKILDLVENGDSTVVEEFFSALEDIGYCDIVKLIDPTDVHNKAENIRKMITSNYKNILEEMQITLARETLSNCIGDVASAKERILPKYGRHRQRMHEFLQFILQEDHNVMQFEKMLKQNGLEELLKINENVKREPSVIQDIEVTIVEDQSSEGVLFESVITVSFADEKTHREYLQDDIVSTFSREDFTKKFETIEIFMKTLGLERYVDTFHANQIDLKLLNCVSEKKLENILRELHLPLAARVKILQNLKTSKPKDKVKKLIGPFDLWTKQLQSRRSSPTQRSGWERKVSATSWGTNYGENEIRIVLLGLSGSGKSASCNTILGGSKFGSVLDFKSVPPHCSQTPVERFGRKIIVVDIPSVFDTCFSDKDVQQEIYKCIGITSPGPHAFILVLNPMVRFTDELERAVLHLLNYFGKEVYRYLVVLFTRKDELDKNEITLSQYLDNASSQLNHIIDKCGKRVFAFNNNLEGKAQDDQAYGLIRMIEDNIERNNGEFYTNDMYTKAEEEIKTFEAVKLRKEKEQLEKERLEKSAVKNYEKVKEEKKYVNRLIDQLKEMEAGKGNKEYSKLLDAKNESGRKIEAFNREQNEEKRKFQEEIQLEKEARANRRETTMDQSWCSIS